MNLCRCRLSTRRSRSCQKGRDILESHCHEWVSVALRDQLEALATYCSQCSQNGQSGNINSRLKKERERRQASTPETRSATGDEPEIGQGAAMMATQQQKTRAQGQLGSPRPLSDGLWRNPGSSVTAQLMRHDVFRDKDNGVKFLLEKPALMEKTRQ